MEFIKENIEIILLGVIIILLLIKPMSKLLRRSKTQATSGKIDNKHNNLSSIDLFMKAMPNLLKELNALQGYKIKAEDYDNLENTLEEIRAKNKQLEKDKYNLLSNKQQLENTLQVKESEVLSKQQVINEQDKIVNQIRKIEHLKEYAMKVIDYLQFFECVIEIANKRCVEFCKKDIETAKIMSVLLQQTLLKTVEIEKWKQICDNIKENDIAVLDKDIRNCFQSDKNEEQLKAFKSLCVSKLKLYTNALLILCESYNNLSKFTENTDDANIENEFKNKIAEIKNNAKEIGIIEISEVKIFTNIGSNNAKAVDGQPSLPYSIVKNLKQGDIVEIISYGMKTEFEDMTKTKVLIS